MATVVAQGALGGAMSQTSRGAKVGTEVKLAEETLSSADRGAAEAIRPASSAAKSETAEVKLAETAVKPVESSASEATVQTPQAATSEAREAKLADTTVKPASSNADEEISHAKWGTTLESEGQALNVEQKSNLKRFLKKIPSNAKDTVTTTQHADGSITFRAISPGRTPNSYAVYEKTLNAQGETLGYTKTTIVPDGSVAHIKDKFNITSE